MRKYNRKTTLSYNKQFDCLTIMLEKNKDIPYEDIDSNISINQYDKGHTTVIEICNLKAVVKQYDTHEKPFKGHNTTVAGITTPMY